MKNKIVEINHYVQLAKDNDDDAYRFLSGHFLRFALYTAHQILEQYSYSKESPNDYLHIYWQALRKAVSKFESSKGSFKALLEVIYVRMLKSAIAEDINKNYALFSAISLDASIGCDDLVLSDVLSDENENIYLESVDSFNAYKYLTEIENMSVKSKRDQLNKLQKMIILYRYCGFKIVEIARILNISLSTLQRLLKDDRDDSPLSELKIALFDDKD